MKKILPGIALVIFICAILGVIGFSLQNYFLIKNISCFENQESVSCPEEMSSLSEPILNRSLFFTELESFIQKFPDQKIEIARKLPDTLLITISHPKDNSSEIQQFSPLPEVENLEDLQKQLLEIDQEVSKIESDDQFTTIYFVNGRRAILTTDSLPADSQKLFMILLYQDLGSIDAGIKEIDVRYELPILRT